MNISKIYFGGVVLLILLFASCQTQEAPVEPTRIFSTEPLSLNTDEAGKRFDFGVFTDLYTRAQEELPMPYPDPELIAAFKAQITALENGRTRHRSTFDKLSISTNDLTYVLDVLSTQYPKVVGAGGALNAWQIKGQDNKGNVWATSYFTPKYRVASAPFGKYKYPIYAKPKNWEGKLPSRKEIVEEGKLDSLGLEIAYASDPLDIHFMQLQGTGAVEFVDTKEKALLAFGGNNGHRYRSIGKYMARDKDIRIGNISSQGIRRFLNKNQAIKDTILTVNPAYTFFKKKHGAVKGAAGVPLLPMRSIAVDPRYIPLGSVLLAEVPTYDEHGKLNGHRHQLLLAQDTGGAIRGAGHIDVYAGVGKNAEKIANQFHHYGRVWLLLPNDQIAQVNKTGSGVELVY